jgi:hypothetical protein
MDDLKVELEELYEKSQSRGNAGLISAGRRHRITIAVAVSGILILMVVSMLRLSRTTGREGLTKGTAVIILMDTSAPAGVYDPETRRRSGTNADDLSEILRDLPVVLHKEAVGSTWDREDQVLKQDPDLVMIHRFCFFHAMNAEFQLGYPPFSDSEELRLPGGQRLSREFLFGQLFGIAENKILTFLGYLGVSNRRTRVLVYSRGEGNGWREADRQDWVTNVERRFPSLNGRIFTISVGPGQTPSFRNPKLAALVKEQVKSILRPNLRGAKN